MYVMMNTKDVSFPGLGLEGKNVCVIHVFSILCSFTENMFAENNCTKIKYTVMPTTSV
jgi:hypothetical protein